MGLTDVLVLKLWGWHEEMEDLIREETLNMEDHIWIKKNTKMYLKRETGDVKIE